MYGQDKGSQWYIDNGCLKQMTRDHKKFLILKEEKGGSVTFGANASERIFGKCVVNIDNGKTKT
jgi:hypothetical protein